jgi:hypothetical protein
LRLVNVLVGRNDQRRAEQLGCDTDRRAEQLGYVFCRTGDRAVRT